MMDFWSRLFLTSGNFVKFHDGRVWHYGMIDRIVKTATG